MVRYPLLHPGILEALAGAGHGSRVLLGDGNSPVVTAVHPRASVVHLNLRRGTVPVEPVLETLRGCDRGGRGDESGRGSRAGHLSCLPAPPARPRLDVLDRSAVYTPARDQDVRVVIATGEQRLFANILLTLGVVQGDLP